MPGELTLLIGTTKGAFLLHGPGDWQVSGPHCGGWPINHVIGDPDTGTIWAGGGGDWHGAGIWQSEDGGQSWTVTRLTRGTMDDWAEKDPDAGLPLAAGSRRRSRPLSLRRLWRGLRRTADRLPEAARAAVRKPPPVLS